MQSPAIQSSVIFHAILYRLATTQGDSYEELGVTIDDRNDDESERKIRIQYSTPPGRPNGKEQTEVRSLMSQYLCLSIRRVFGYAQSCVESCE